MQNEHSDHRHLRAHLCFLGFISCSLHNPGLINDPFGPYAIWLTPGGSLFCLNASTMFICEDMYYLLDEYYGDHSLDHHGCDRWLGRVGDRGHERRVAAQHRGRHHRRGHRRLAHGLFGLRRRFRFQSVQLFGGPGRSGRVAGDREVGAENVRSDRSAVPGRRIATIL
jgi:hypothetical protein